MFTYIFEIDYNSNRFIDLLVQLNVGKDTLMHAEAVNVNPRCKTSLDKVLFTWNLLSRQYPSVTEGVEGL